MSGLEPNEERPGYTTREQVERFFKHPVYLGQRSKYFYNSPGKVVVRAALYWVPLLAAHQLMRRDEICQLKVKHIKVLNDIWHIDLFSREIKVKRASSRRRIPLHKGIISLGFVSQCVNGRDTEEYLFPELARSASGSLSDGVGKRVGRMIDSLGIKLVRVDDTEADGALHPFRHFGITQLENQLHIKGGIIDALTGHASAERQSERKRYTDEIYLSVLQEAINALVVPVDIDELNHRYEQFKNRPKEGA